MVRYLSGIAAEDVRCNGRPVFRMKNVHLFRQVPQPAKVFLLDLPYRDVDVDGTPVLEVVKYQTAEHYVADHQAARADRREQKRDEPARSSPSAATSSSPRRLPLPPPPPRPTTTVTATAT